MCGDNDIDTLRTSCNTCKIAWGDLFGGTIIDKTCIQTTKGSGVCTNCVAFGLPCYSLTTDSQTPLESGQSALSFPPAAQILGYMQFFQPQMRSLGADKKVDDDASNCEDGDLDGSYLGGNDYTSR